MSYIKHILLVVLSFYTIQNSANYSTPGTGKSWNLDSLVAYSGGIVTFSSGSYFINDTLIVTSPDTIKILSNATVKLAFNVVFNTLGTLIINPPDSVKFTSADTTQKFYELRLDDLSDASVLKKLIFEYSFNGLRLLDTNPLIDNCTIRYNCGGNPSTTVPAINLFRSNAVIQNCKIYRNYKAAIAGGSNIANAPQILFNNIYENNISNGNVPQINLGQSGSGTTIIKGNIIRGLYSNTGGIATLPIGTLNINIEDNIIKNNRYGIAITNANTFAVIKRNIIDSNNIQGSPSLGGSGINFNGNSTLTAVVSRNTIRGNLWGITIQGTAKPNMGNLANTDTNYIGLNYIFWNGNSGRIYDLYNNTPDSIKAENNFWGTGILDSIEAHIFHKPDSAALGFVDYLPLHIPIGINPGGFDIPREFKLYDAYPNPFNPVTNIKYQIAPLNPPEGGKQHVMLKVYDITGKEITVLVNEELSAGTYETVWDASGYSSGVYFYKIETSTYSDTKKMILIK